MEYVLFAVVLLAFYAVRDSELLRLFGDRQQVSRRVVLYALSIGFAVITAATLAIPLDFLSYLQQIREPSVVKPLLGLQLGIWFYWAWLRRTGGTGRLWTVAVVPSPVLVLCLTGLTVYLHPAQADWPGRVLVLLVAALWISAIALWARWSMQVAGEDPAWGLGVAGVSNVFIVLLLPTENLLAEVRNLMTLIFAQR